MVWLKHHFSDKSLLCEGHSKWVIASMTFREAATQSISGLGTSEPLEMQKSKSGQYVHRAPTMHCTKAAQPWHAMIMCIFFHLPGRIVGVGGSGGGKRYQRGWGQEADCHWRVSLGPNHRMWEYSMSWEPGAQMMHFLYLKLCVNTKPHLHTHDKSEQAAFYFLIL